MKRTKLTTPSGTYFVRLPREWKGVRPMKAGEEFRGGDKCLTAGGRLLECGPASMEGKHAVAERPGYFPVGYYFRRTEKALKACGL